MSRIVETPAPPYYAVIAPAALTRDIAGYPELAQRLIACAGEVDGFIGIETCYRENFVLAVSYWRSLQAIERWRDHPDHRAAKQHARDRWFAQYVTRIAKVEHSY